MNIIKHIIFTLFFSVAFSLLYGQDIRARVSGLETDSVYMSLLREEALLKTQEDSLLGVIRAERARFTTDTTNLYARSQQILKLEEDVFDIRNQLGMTASKINGIEQEYILNNLFASGSPHTAAGPSSNYPNLIDNDYFKENLTAEEYGQLKHAQTLKRDLRKNIEAYQENYQRLKELSVAYDSVFTQTEANSLYEVCQRQWAELRKTEGSFAGEWGDSFNQEVYLYSYLLDKLNRMDDLAKLNEKSRTRRVYSSKEVMSVALAEYPGQQDLLIDYELAVAGALKLTAAVDSLNRVRETFQKYDLAFPKIEITEKEFVHYQSVSFPETPLYNAENPIPEWWIPEVGTYYSVTVGTFSQKQPVSTFRGAVPVYYERLRSGQYRYYIGLFRSYGDASEAVQELKETGFRRPEPVRWKDQVYENLAALVTQSTGLYRIVVEVSQGELPEDVRFLLNRYARNKEVTRVGTTYYVGTFTDKIHVEDVMQALGRVDGLDPKVEEIVE